MNWPSAATRTIYAALQVTADATPSPIADTANLPNLERVVEAAADRTIWFVAVSAAAGAVGLVLQLTLQDGLKGLVTRPGRRGSALVGIAWVVPCIAVLGLLALSDSPWWLVFSATILILALLIRKSRQSPDERIQEAAQLLTDAEDRAIKARAEADDLRRQLRQSERLVNETEAKLKNSEIVSQELQQDLAWALRKTQFSDEILRVMTTLASGPPRGPDGQVMPSAKWKQQVKTVMDLQLETACALFGDEQCFYRAVIFLPMPGSRGLIESWASYRVTHKKSRKFLVEEIDQGSADPKTLKRLKDYSSDLGARGLARGLAVLAWTKKDPIFVRLVEQNGRWEPDDPELAKHYRPADNKGPSYRSLAVLPLLDGADRCIGILCADSRNKDSFESEGARDYAGLLAVQLAAALSASGLTNPNRSL